MQSLNFSDVKTNFENVQKFIYKVKCSVGVLVRDSSGKSQKPFYSKLENSPKI